jgi:putative flippase GtrA
LEEGFLLKPPEIDDSVEPSPARQNTESQRPSFWMRWFGQLVRFGLVGGVNTAIDLLTFNGLLWLFPTSNLLVSLLFNTLAYSVGAINSFLLNKYWTFQRRQRITAREVSRFVITTLLGIGCNDLLLWSANSLLSPLIAYSRFWVNASKIIALVGTVLISYLGMRLWVFTNRQERRYVKSDTDKTFGLSYNKDRNKS